VLVVNIVQSPAEVIELVPAILGFPPTESMVIVTMRDSAVTCVIRFDLDDPARQVAVEQVATAVARNQADGALAVVVSAAGAVCPICVEQYRQLVSELTVALDRRAVTMLGAYVVDRVAAGGRWRCLDGCGEGVLGDPASSPDLFLTLR
jgi:hypothetical protein